MTVSGAPQHVHACSERAQTLPIRSHGAYGVAGDANLMQRARQWPTRMTRSLRESRKAEAGHRPLWRRGARLGARRGGLNHFPTAWRPPAPANGEGHGVGFSTCRSQRGIRAWFERRSSPSLARTHTARTQGLPEAPTECVGSAQRQRDRQQRRTPPSSARSSPSMARVRVILFVILWSPCEIGICFTLGSGNLLDESTLRGQRGPVLAAKFGRVPRNQFGEGRATGGHLARRAGSLGVACTAVVPVKP